MMKLFKKLAFSHCPQASAVNSDQPLTPLVDLPRQLFRWVHNLSPVLTKNPHKAFIRKPQNKNQQTDTADFKNIPSTQWIPIIKSTARTHYCATTKQHANLSGHSVLCVDGRKKYYPDYHQATNALNGKLIVFRSDTNQHLEQLHRQVEDVDLIICPIDCINHDAFLIVKYYCKYTGKPCVFLDQSLPSTFRAGLEVLAHMLPNIATRPTPLINAVNH